MDSSDVPIWVWVLGLGALLLAWIAISVHEQAEWDKFSATHACVKVGHKTGHYDVGFGSGNNGTWVSATDSFKCDDGVTYER